jgi:DNA-binding NarL/FixJ family response regulator
VESFRVNRREGLQKMIPLQPSPRHPSSENLSPREREVLELLAQGFLYNAIMESLKISRSAVNTHIRGRTLECFQ